MSENGPTSYLRRELKVSSNLQPYRAHAYAHTTDSTIPFPPQLGSLCPRRNGRQWAS